MLIYFWEKDKEWEWKRSREGEEDRESEAGSVLSVQSLPDAELKPTNCKIMTWAKVGCSTDWSTPQAPLLLVIFSWDVYTEEGDYRELYQHFISTYNNAYFYYLCNQDLGGKKEGGSISPAITYIKY